MIHAVVLASAQDPVKIGTITTMLAGLFGAGVLAVALRAVLHGFKSEVSKVLTIAGIVALAAMIYSLGTGGLFSSLGSDMVRWFLNV